MGAKSPTELWVSKAEGLKNRVGGLINYKFLDKLTSFKKRIIFKISFEWNFIKAEGLINY